MMSQISYKLFFFICCWKTSTCN